MIQIRLDSNAINVLKNFGIFIEVESLETKAPAPELSLPTPPQSITASQMVASHPHLYTEEQKRMVAQPSMQIPRIPVTPAPSHSAQAQGTPQTDKAGQAWNPEIHSSSKAFNKDGTWRLKRGLDPQVLASMRANAQGPTRTRTEIAARMEEAAPAFQPPPVPAANVAQQHVDFHNKHIQEVPQPQQIQPTIETKHVGNELHSIPNAQGIHAHTFATFKDNLIPVFAALVKEGKITQEYVEELKKYFGIKELWNLFTDDKKLLELFENFCGANLIQRIEG